MEEEIKKIKRNRNIVMSIIITIGILICGYIILVNETSFGKKCTETTGISRMYQQEKDIYNSTVQKYIGDSTKGSNVKKMIENIISQNYQNVDENGKYISIYVKDIKKYNNEEKLAEINQKVNKFENENGENNQENIEKASNEYKKISEKISSNKKYKVEAEYKEGIIYKVTITELKNSKKDDKNE